MTHTSKQAKRHTHTLNVKHLNTQSSERATFIQLAEVIPYQLNIDKIIRYSFPLTHANFLYILVLVSLTDQRIAAKPAEDRFQTCPVYIRNTCPSS
jgi:hypothetical protein